MDLDHAVKCFILICINVSSVILILGLKVFKVIKKKSTKEKQRKNKRIKRRLLGIRSRFSFSPNSLLKVSIILLTLAILSPLLKELCSFSIKKLITYIITIIFVCLFMYCIYMMINTVLNAANRCYGNRANNDYLTFLEAIMLFTLIESNYYIYDNLPICIEKIFLVEVTILFIIVVMDQYNYIKNLLKRLIKGNLSYTKKEAISECFLIYLSMPIILTTMVFILFKADQFWKLFGLYGTDEKDIIPIPLYACLRFCALTFIGMSFSEFETGGSSFSIIILVIRIIGLLTSGFITVEILSHVVSEKRKKQEVYWETRYELEHSLLLVNRILDVFNREKSIEGISKKGLNEFIEALPERIVDMNYYSNQRKNMEVNLQKLRNLLSDIYNNVEATCNKDFDDIRKQINNYKKSLLLIEKGLQKELKNFID